MASIKKMKCTLGAFSIDIDNLDWPDHGLVGIVGPSGVGKTSFLKILIGFQEATFLEWSWSTLQMDKLKLGEKRIGYVPQSYDLFEGLSVRDNIEFGLGSRKDLSAKDKNEKAFWIAEQLDLVKLYNQNVAHLSGGEAQRVALARAIAWEPRMLFMDEPFSALDNDLRSQARQLTLSLIEKLQIPTLLVSHFPEDLRQAQGTIVFSTKRQPHYVELSKI